PLDLKKARYLAPESKGANVTPESDMWCLGATVFETLTQKTWAEGEREKADVLPEPFATIALRCLVAEPGERCRLAEVVALARGEIKPAPRPKPVPPPPVAPPPLANTPVAPAPTEAAVLPINEKEIHAPAQNGTSPLPAAAQPKSENPTPRAGDAKPPVPPPSSTASAAAAAPAPAPAAPAPAAPAPNSTAKNEPTI